MKVRIEDETVVVHKDADLNSPPIAELVSGAEIELANTLERMGVEWGEVVLSDGQRGYIPGDTQIEPLETDEGSAYRAIKKFVRRSLLTLSALLALYNFTIYPALLEVGRTTYKVLTLKSWGVSDQSAYYWDRRTGPYLVLSILLFALALIAGESATIRKIGIGILFIGVMLTLFSIYTYMPEP